MSVELNPSGSATSPNTVRPRIPQWELLVTEGHVRAARWRKAFPVLLALSIGSIVLAFFIFRLVPVSQPSTKVADAKAAYAAEQRSAVAAFFQGQSAAVPVTSPQDAAQAMNPQALNTRLAELLAFLRDENRLPDNVVRQDAATFWRGEGSVNEVHAVEDGRTILIGATVNTAIQGQGYTAPPELRRSYWIFRRPEASWIWRGGAPYDWTQHCLAVAGAVPCARDAVDPSTIPGTIRGLLPDAAFETRP
jgi:hypothetical protein